MVARSLDRLQCLQCLLCAQMAMLCIYVCLTRARDFCTLQCAHHRNRLIEAVMWICGCLCLAVIVASSAVLGAPSER